MFRKLIPIPILVTLGLLVGCWSAPGYANPYIEKNKKPLEWETVVQLVRTNNPNILKSQLEIEIQTQNLHITKGTTGPQISAKLSGSAGLSNTNTSGAGLLDFQTESGNTGADATMTLSQILWNGGKTDYQITAAVNQLQVNQAAANQSDSDTLAKIRRLFLQLWFSQQTIQLNQSILARRTDQYELLRYRYASGLEHQGALLISKANLADAVASLDSAQRLAQYHRLALSQTIPADLSDYSNPLISSNNIPITISSENVYALAQSHPNVIAAQAALAAAKATYRASIADVAPQIGLSASLSKSISGYDPWRHSNRASAQINMSFPIWDGHALGGAQTASELRVRSAELSLQSIQTDTVLSLQSAFIERQNAIAAFNVQTQYLQAHSIRADIAAIQYKSGLISFNDWIVIENNLIQSQTALLRAQLDVWQAESNWQNAKGASF